MASQRGSRRDAASSTIHSGVCPAWRTCSTLHQARSTTIDARQASCCGQADQVQCAPVHASTPWGARPFFCHAHSCVTTVSASNPLQIRPLVCKPRGASTAKVNRPTPKAKRWANLPAWIGKAIAGGLCMLYSLVRRARIGRAYMRLNTKAPLVPPKPKLFLRAAWIGRSRASLAQ